MKYRKLDAAGDYVFGVRDAFLTGADAVAQAIRSRLGLFAGEWWENTEDGLPLFQRILGRRGGIDLMVGERILETPGVRAIIKYESATNGRRYEAVCTVRTDYGDISIDAGAVN